MKKPIYLFLFAVAWMCTSASYAQVKWSPGEEETFYFISRNHAGDEVMGMFRQTQSPFFQDPKAPRFLLVDQKHKFALGIGGYVKLTASYDFRGIADNPDFITYDIPVPNNRAETSQYQMDVATSRLFLKLVGSTKALGNFVAYIETDFRGTKNALRLRQAYISLKGFLAGQAWSTFSDLASVPPTIDFEQANGNTTLRTVQLRYTYAISKHWEAALAVEAPRAGATTTQFDQLIKQRMPDIPAYLQFGWGKQSHLRLSGLLRGLSYRNNLINENKTQLGWGVQLSGLADITPALVFYYQGTYGKGIAEYIKDMGGSNLDLVPDPHKAGDLQTLPTYALSGGLQFNFSPKVFASLSYSQVRMYSQNGYYSADEYKYAQYAVANVFWDVVPNVQLGAEYLYGRRVNMNKEAGHANRIQTMIRYNF